MAYGKPYITYPFAFVFRYGRLKVLIASQTAIIIIGFLSAFSSNIGVYIAARAIIGFFVPGCGVNLFILASEFVGTRYRPMAGNLLWLFFTIGLILLGVKAYFIRQWKILIIVCTAPYVFCLIFFKFIPESIRWLRLDGQGDKALDILRKMGRINKREIPEDIKLVPTDENSSHKSSPMDIFRTKKRAVASFIQGYAWAVNGVVYYGITFASDDLGGSMHRDYILASLIEFPSYLSSMYLCNRFGRKKTVSIPMFIASVGCILVAFIPYNSIYTHWTVLRVVCCMIGKFCIALSFGSIYIWSAELYPTMVRGQGMGFLQIASRFGSAFAPWVAKWLKVFHYVLPFAVMAGGSLIAAIMLQWLPETANKPSPESLEEDRETPSDQHISLRSSETEMLNMQHTETEPI